MAIEAQAAFILSCSDPRKRHACRVCVACPLLRAVRSASRRFRASSPEEASRSSPAHATEQDRPDMPTPSGLVFESQLDLDPEKLVFIGEDLGLHEHGAKMRSRSQGTPARRDLSAIGKRRLSWPRTEARRNRRPTLSGFDGPINAQVFEAYVEQFLAPTLRAGDVVVMDNLSSHKRPKVRALIEATGAPLLSTSRPTAPEFQPN